MSLDDILKKIEHFKELNLPENNQHFYVLPINRRTPDFGNLEQYRPTAVAIHLFPEAGELRSILIRRPEYAGKHSGQISFPGGKQDTEDPSLEYTARRESYEEVGVELESGTLISKLGKVYIPVSGFSIEPYVFYHHEKPALQADSREVAAIIPFGIRRLLDEDVLKRGKIRFSSGIIQQDVPYFDIEQEVVWGATAMILAEFRSLLLEPH